MNSLDIIFLVLLVRAIFVGATRGLLRVVLSFLAVILAGSLVYVFSLEIISMGAKCNITSPRVTLSLAFFGLLIATYTLAWLGTKLIDASGLGLPNKILGILFSVSKVCLLLGCAFFATTSLFAHFEKPLPELFRNSYSFNAYSYLFALI